MFEKGKSGNPGGRSKVDKRFGDVWDKREEYPGLDGIEKAAALLADIAFNAKESARDRMRAAELFMHYRVGKPREKIELEGSIAPGAIAFIDALRMTPHERRLLAAQESTADDDAAMTELVNGDDEICG
jgi:hypothetical protein